MSTSKQKGGRRKSPLQSRSGPTLSQERRRELGRPIVALVLPTETLEVIDELAARLGCSRGAVVVQAVGALVEVMGREG